MHARTTAILTRAKVVPWMADVMKGTVSRSNKRLGPPGRLSQRAASSTKSYPGLASSRKLCLQAGQSLVRVDGRRRSSTREDPFEKDRELSTRVSPGLGFGPAELESEGDDAPPAIPADVDILAEMDDPPVLDRFAGLPIPSHSYSLSSYVEHSATLQRLVEMGVDLSKVEKKRGIPSRLLRMDFDEDIKGILVYLNAIGVAGEELGKFISKNPHILVETIGDLQARVDYLKSKKFSDKAVGNIVNRAPYFLSFSVLRVDRKLGYLQQLLHLKGSEVREVITKEPRLVTFKVSKIQENVFVLREQLGFQKSELKALVVKEPKLLLRGKYRLVGIFDYVHNVMDIPHTAILHAPQVFNSRLHKIQERHQYLKSIGRDNYQPSQPQYVPLEKLGRVPDDVFCEEIARSSVADYNAFLKTL